MAQNDVVFNLDRAYSWQLRSRALLGVVGPGTEDLFQFDLEFTEDRIA